MQVRGEQADREQERRQYGHGREEAPLRARAKVAPRGGLSFWRHDGGGRSEEMCELRGSALSEPTGELAASVGLALPCRFVLVL